MVTAKSVEAKRSGVKKKRVAVKRRDPLNPERIAAILDILAETYPGVVCALTHRNAWELTVATILSAQCTDVRVNLVTPRLVQGVSYSKGDDRCFPSRDRRSHSHNGLLPQQGKVDSRSCPCGRRGVWR